MALVSIDLTRPSEEDLIDLNRRIVERLRLIRSARQLVQLARFTVGMQVEFATDDGRIVRGAITKLNRKTATVGLRLEGWLQKVARQEATWNVCAHPRGRPTACSRPTVLALPMSPTAS